MFSSYPSMKKLLIASLLGIGLPLLSFADIERTVEKSFHVEPGQRLKVETFSGSIHVRSSNEPIVKIEVKQKIDASSDEKADEIVSKMEMRLETDAKGVVAVAKMSEKHFGGFFGHWSNPVRLEWNIEVPSSYSVDLDTSGGGIYVSDLKGNVLADTSGGGIDLGNIDGEVKADTSGGSIKLKSATGTASLDTSGGGIHVGTAKAHLNANTSGGSIQVNHAENTVKADTSGGGIEVSFFGPIQGDCDLDTSGGGITVKVDANAAFDLQADTSAGRVSCDLPISNLRSREKDHLSGKVNGGGPRMRLDTSAGSIRISTN